MGTFWTVTLFHLQLSRDSLFDITNQATEEYSALGTEEFSLNESEVDDLLGERSYSGGDLPLEVLDEVEEQILNRPGNYRFFFNSQDNANEFRNEMSKQYLCETQVEECPEEDWNAEWKKHYSPIRINEFLEVVPSWQKEHKSDAVKKIFIYPGMGFGTGSHETTFLCLKLFVENLLSKKIHDVLDFGSGSGILGLSTLLFFPDSRVDFYDIDSEANKNCFLNAQINGLEDRSFRLLLPEVRDKMQPRYQLVFANILESILLAEKNSLISLLDSEGFLILSGLLKHQVQNVLDAYLGPKLSLIAREEKGDWAALLFKKV